VVNKIYVS